MKRHACALTLAALAARAAPPSPAAAALQAALDAAIAARAPTFTLPAGAISFNGASFNVSNATRIAIGGAPGARTTLVFEPGFGVAVADATNATLHDFAIDYAPLPFVFGPIRGAPNASHFLVELDAASLTFAELAARYPPHDTWPGCGIFRAGELVRSACGWGAPPPAAPAAGAARTFAVACDVRGAAAGDVFVAATRVGITLSLSRCARVAVRDVDVLAAGYMAVTEFQGDGGNVYERVRVAPPSPARPLGSNADGFHSSGTRVGPTLSHVQISNLLDDYFNVHTTAQLYIGPAGGGAHLVGDYQLFAGGNTNYGTQTTLDRVAPGENMSFYPLNTFSWPPLATATVARLARVDGAAADALLADAYARASAAAVATPCSACNAGLKNFSSAQLWNVTPAAPLAGVPPLSFATADGISAAGARLADCTFSDSITNLGRWKSSNSRIERTTWARTGKQNLEIEPLQHWLEGPFGPHNVTIDSCVFEGTRVSPVHTFGAVDVVQTNNSFVPGAALD
jgi:hypothetical protein